MPAIEQKETIKGRFFRSAGLAVMAAACLFSCRKEPGKELPNIVVIVADDLGYGDLGCYGNGDIRTPNIDSLAAAGIRFTDFHSNGVVCSPTRAALMTGKYPQECGISGVITAKDHRNVGLDTAEVLIPEYLKRYGYATGIMGKWHLGYDTVYSPVVQGFDIFKGYTSGNVDYISHFDQENYYDWWRDKRHSTQEGYLTDLITSAALAFIEQHKEQPFFLYVAHGAPHSPYQNRSSPPIRDGKTTLADITEDTVRKKELYREMIEIMDAGVGAILQSLQRHRLAENTLVLFLSDNGATRIGSNAPFKGYKGQVWEGGHRVPAIVNWKGVTAPGVSDELVTTMDVFPTIADLVGGGKGSPPRFSGRSFRELLTGKPHKTGDRAVFWSFRDAAAVREGQWKLVKQQNSYYLFDLNADPAESRDISAENPGKNRELLQMLNEWLGQVAAFPQKS